MSGYIPRQILPHENEIWMNDALELMVRELTGEEFGDPEFRRLIELVRTMRANNDEEREAKRWVAICADSLKGAAREEAAARSLPVRPPPAQSPPVRSLPVQPASGRPLPIRPAPVRPPISPLTPPPSSPRPYSYPDPREFETRPPPVFGPENQPAQQHQPQNSPSLLTDNRIQECAKSIMRRAKGKVKLSETGADGKGNRKD